MTQLLTCSETRRFTHSGRSESEQELAHISSSPFRGKTTTTTKLSIICMFLCNNHTAPSSLLPAAAFFTETESKMKLWDVLATCLLLLSSVAAARPLYQSARPAKRTYYPGGYSDTTSAEDQESNFQLGDDDQRGLQEVSMEDACKSRR